MPYKSIPLQAITDYNNGLGQNEVANKYNVCVQTLVRWLKRHNVKVRSRKEVSFTNIKRWRERTPNFQSGERNPFYKNGLSRSTIRRICKRILTEAGIDQHTCQRCLIYSSVRQNVHHIDEDRSNNKLSNLMVLCARCHNIVHEEKHEGRRLRCGRYGKFSKRKNSSAKWKSSI